MPDNKIEDFEVEKVFENRLHERLAFTFKVKEQEFKGHYHNNEIQWLNPSPIQMLDENTVERIEATVHSFMQHYLVLNDIQEIEITPVFEDTPHERHKVSIHVQGEEYKGLVHNGEIQWFHPQPLQNLDKDTVQALETEIQEKVEQHEQDKFENK